MQMWGVSVSYTGWFLMGSYSRQGKYIIAGLANVQPGQAPCAASKNQPNGTAIKKLSKTVDI